MQRSDIGTVEAHVGLYLNERPEAIGLGYLW